MPEETIIEPLILREAAKDLSAYWPFLLRYGVISLSEALKSYILAKKNLDYVGAYTAYESAIGIAVKFLYCSIFSVVTLMADAKREEDESENNPEKVKEAREKIRLIWRQGVIFAALLSVPAVIFGVTASPLFKLFKQSDVVIDNSKLFLYYSTPGFVADIAYRLTARTVSGLGVRKSILVADTIDQVLELFFTYAFLNAKFGMPGLGLPGAAAAYSVSKIITVLGHLFYMAASPAFLNFDYKKYELFSRKGRFFDKDIFKTLVGAGIPDGLNSVFSTISSMLVVMFCGQSGMAPLVGLRAASVYSGFATFHLSAVINAACTQIGSYYSVLTDTKNKYSLENKRIAVANAKLYAKLLFALCSTISFIACGLAFTIPRQLAKLFIDENEASNQVYLSHAINFIKIQGVFEVVAGVMSPAESVLSSVLDNQFLMYATIFFNLLCNPAAAAVAHYGLHKDSEWVFSASELGTIFMTIVLLYRMSKKLNSMKADNGANVPEQMEADPARQKSNASERLKHYIWTERTSDNTVDPSLLERLPTTLQAIVV